MSTASRKVTLSIPVARYEEMEQVATSRNITVPKVILERLEEWCATASVSTLETLISQQFQELLDQIRDLQEGIQEFRQYPPVSSLSDPQIRTVLQPIQNRLQQQDVQIGVLGNLTQQILPQMLKHQIRLEIWLEALYVMSKPPLLDGQPEEIKNQRQQWMDELWERLERHLKAQE